MKRIPFYVALAVLCLAMTDCTSKKKMEIKMKPYPQTAKVDVSDNYHGTVVADPYRWLEDDNSAEIGGMGCCRERGDVRLPFADTLPSGP